MRLVGQGFAPSCREEALLRRGLLHKPIELFKASTDDLLEHQRIFARADQQEERRVK